MSYYYATNTAAVKEDLAKKAANPLRGKVILENTGIGQGWSWCTVGDYWHLDKSGHATTKAEAYQQAKAVIDEYDATEK